MGILDFIKDAGEDLFGGKKGNEADEIRKKVEKDLGSNVEGLGVLYKDGRVELHGTAKSQAAKEKAALIAGNVKGVTNVDDDGLTVAGQESAPQTAPQVQYYTIQSGDSLSKIAQDYYGDAQKYDAIFEANREVIKDPDKIYPGQKIRIPENA